jgi:hypothetical protein
MSEQSGSVGKEICGSVAQVGVAVGGLLVLVGTLPVPHAFKHLLRDIPRVLEDIEKWKKKP